VFIFMLKKILLTLGVLLTSSQSAWADAPVYRFSPVNQWDLTRTAAYWNPIIRYVSERSGVKLELKLGRTSADTTAYVLAQEVEFVFSNHLFSPERDKLGWKVFGRRMGPALTGQIAVPFDSPINALEELEGEQVAFAGREAFVGYRVTYAEFLRRKINVTPVFAGNQNAAFVQMFSGKTKAVGSNSALIDGYNDREGKKFKVLWTSEGYHDLALMASDKVPEQDLKAVSRAFFGMHKDAQGRAILQRVSEEVGLTDSKSYFIPSTNADYSNYRRFYDTAPAAVR